MKCADVSVFCPNMAMEILGCFPFGNDLRGFSMGFFHSLLERNGLLQDVNPPTCGFYWVPWIFLRLASWHGFIQGKSTRTNMGSASRMRSGLAKGSGVKLWDWGLGVWVWRCVRSGLPAAAGRSRPPPFAMRDLGGCCKSCRLWKP